MLLINRGHLMELRMQKINIELQYQTKTTKRFASGKNGRGNTCAGCFRTVAVLAVTAPRPSSVPTPAAVLVEASSSEASDSTKRIDGTTSHVAPNAARGPWEGRHHAKKRVPG